MTTPTLEVIGCSTFKGQAIVVTRDQNGKYHVEVDGTMTQKRLTAAEVVRWFLNVMEDKESS